MSQILTNVICIEGDSKKIEEFIGEVKERKIKVVYVRCPKDTTNIKESTKFINSKWKVAKMDLKNKIIYSRKNSNVAYFVFSHNKLNYELINIVQKLKLNAHYNYLISDKNGFRITTEEFDKGKQVSAKISSPKDKKPDNYSVAICLE